MAIPSEQDFLAYPRPKQEKVPRRPVSFFLSFRSAEHKSLRKRHYIHSFRIFQPQPSRGKIRRILTRSKPHTSGNTSSREDNTTLNKNQTSCSPWSLLIPGPILRSDFPQSLVPAGSGSYPQIRLFAVPGSCWFRVLSLDQTFRSPWFLLVSGPILRSDFPQSLVHAGSGSYPQIRLPAIPGFCWFRVLSSYQTFCSPWFLLVPGPILRSNFLQSLVPNDSGSDFLQSLVPAGSGSYPHIRSPQSSDLPVLVVPTQSRCLQLLTPVGSGSSLRNKSQQPSDPMGAAITKQALDDIHTSRLTTPPHMRKMQGSQAGHNIFRPGSLPKRREHCFSASCKGAEEKRELYIKTCWPSDSWVQLEQRRVPDPRSNVPDPRSRIQVPGLRLPNLHGGEIQWLHKKQDPTTLLPLFPVTNPDIPLKEIKAFYPLQTPGETQDPCLSKSPRLHPSTSCKKREFPVKESRIRQSTRK
ncbi:hypothetical protein HID58_087915 [Brassica napus]|uniref:Uncharacterized protein n=1 Tax=Brassica napus TaxID=3708 RepID=A0ABQ7XUN2_BRANA|nr:hypothetical protein HID58_087915 [Brassica napus]